jgi:hypothetical protein
MCECINVELSSSFTYAPQRIGLYTAAHGCVGGIFKQYARSELLVHWERRDWCNVFSLPPWVNFLQKNLYPLYTYRSICGDDTYQVFIIIIIIIRHELGFDRRVLASSDTSIL